MNQSVMSLSGRQAILEGRAIGRAMDCRIGRARFDSLKWLAVWRQRFQSEEGGTLVEAALTLTLLMMVIFGIMDCSRALYADHYVRYTAEEAVRYAQVRGSTWNNTPCSTPTTMDCTATAANVQAQVASVMPAGIDSGSNLSVVTTWTGLTPTGAACSVTNGANSPGCMVQVKVSYSFNFVLPFLPANALVLSSTSASAITQ
jgi:Flp pilus assembly protein TadG